MIFPEVKVAHEQGLLPDEYVHLSGINPTRVARPDYEGVLKGLVTPVENAARNESIILERTRIAIEKSTSVVTGLRSQANIEKMNIDHKIDVMGANEAFISMKHAQLLEERAATAEKEHDALMAKYAKHKMLFLDYVDNIHEYQEKVMGLGRRLADEEKEIIEQYTTYTATMGTNQQVDNIVAANLKNSYIAHLRRMYEISVATLQNELLVPENERDHNTINKLLGKQITVANTIGLLDTTWKKTIVGRI